MEHEQQQFVPGQLDRELLYALDSFLNPSKISQHKLQKGHEIHGPDNVIAGPREKKKKYVEISGDSES